MKNILHVKPDLHFDARLRFSTGLIPDAKIKNKKILDIGCGFGWFEVHVLKKGVKEVAGIEISKLDLQPAKANIIDKRALFKIGGALKLPFKDNYFDTVVAWDVIEHIPKNTEEIMFQEVYRVLKRGGVFYLSTPYDSMWSTYSDPAWWLIGHRHYSKKKLADFGNNNGLRLSKIYIKGRWWSLVNILNLYIAKWIFRRKRFLENTLLYKENNEYKKSNGFMEIFAAYEKK